MRIQTVLTSLWMALFLLLCWPLSSPASESTPFVQLTRPLGMGGAFTAVADDDNVFAFNPAGMVQRTAGEWTILDLAVGSAEDTKEAWDYIQDHEDQFKDFDLLLVGNPAQAQQIIDDINTKIAPLRPRVYLAGHVATYVSGPKFFGLPIHFGVGPSVGAQGTFNLAVVASTISPSGMPAISYEMYADSVLPLSVAKRFEAPWIIPGKIGLGYTAKFIQRSRMVQPYRTVDTLEDYSAPPAQTGHGFGNDVGALYQPTAQLNLAVVVKDLWGTKIKYDSVDAEDGYPAQPEYSTIITPTTNLGVAWMPTSLLGIIPTGNRLTLAADMWDVTAENRDVWGQDFWFHSHFGAEFRYWFLRFRGGVQDRYPSLGLGVDFPFVKVDYSFYSRELGASPGQRQEKNHVISLAVKFGSGQTQARERIKGTPEPKSKSESEDSLSAETPGSPASSANGQTPASPDQTGEQAPSGAPRPADVNDKK